MVQTRGSRGLRIAGGQRSMSFPASQLFINCHHFPSEFSIVTTINIPVANQQRDSEYVFTLLDEGKDRVLLGLSVARGDLHFIFWSERGRRRVPFRSVSLADGRWHTLVLAVSGPYATLTLDCGMPLELLLDGAFPSELDTTGSRFFIGSRRRYRGLFSGLLRQLVLLPGSDATPRVCPSAVPSLAVLSVPPSLLLIPPQDGSDNQLPMLPYEAEVRVTEGMAPPCGELQQGQLWVDTQHRGLYLCDGLMWLPMIQEHTRLDYVEDHQHLYTRSKTFDTEVFTLPDMGLFLATAGRDSHSGSALYRWQEGEFRLFQNISTHEAQAWKFFTIGKRCFLVVANAGGTGGEYSVIYKWSSQKQKFFHYQRLRTHTAQDWEAFSIEGEAFLAVANHRRADNNHNIDSVIYKWNVGTRVFQVNQTIQTSGAYDWEFFRVGPYHFLAVANTFDGETTRINSTIYVWVAGRFTHFQNITTFGATDWEMFEIGGRVFLAVANGELHTAGSSLYSIDSTIYELNMDLQRFIRFQDILTHTAVDWEFFTIGTQSFLVVANSYNGTSYTLKSVIYRWQGSEGFVAAHDLLTVGCRDWEFFNTTEGSFLVYASATTTLSKVFRLKTY
ncbi:thrombospondin-type laminin G domain and EAR repeat-containing protein-like [Engraulis encrasicolus]|uniref:thrombospondin-type laminin G domain and EAR repeat-containing protein-like n=1 Tax=Engraulis encrasicolus TaxID=184585 RepID=UPI002FD2B415